MKRLILFVLLIMSSIVVNAAGFEYTYKGKTLYYTITGSNTVSVKKSPNYSITGTLEIPSLLSNNGIVYTVTKIDTNAFKNCYNVYYSEGIPYFTGLTSVIIPNSVTTIGDSAFYGCQILQSVIIGNSVTSIGAYAFYKCNLTSVTIPNSVTTIGKYVFGHCGNLTTLNYNADSCGGEGFSHLTYYPYDYSSWLSGCDSITTVNIGNNVKVIPKHFIRGKSNVTSFTMGDSVKNIGDSAFYRCSSLTSVNIPNSVTSIGKFAFAGCSSLTSVNIPDSITTIERNTFAGCISLTSVNIPNSVTTIEMEAFYNCSSLTSVNIPNSVDSIKEWTFSSCSSLTSVTIPNSVTSIGNYAFYDCSSLTSVTIPNSVTSIGNYAFSGCSSLTTITIPNSVRSIKNRTFENCSNLTSITLPHSLLSIGYKAFSGCSSLINISIPSSVIYIDNAAFYGCSSLASITIYNLVAHIKDSTFYGCSSLTDITLPNSLISIKYRAFAGCSSLTSVTIPNSVTSIEGSAFSGCSSLKNITIPNSVSSIGSYAFSGCYQLDTIIYYRTTPPNITLNTFSHYGHLFVPCPAVFTYQVSSVWNSFDIQPLAIPEFASAEVTICNNESYILNGKALTQAGTYIDTLQTSAGCDSVVTLTLHVNPAYTNNIEATICNNETYMFNGRALTNAGVYTDSLQKTNGCDSIITLTLHTKPAFKKNISATICNGETYTFNGRVLNSSGTYRDSLQAINGCDSIIILTLNVKPKFNDNVEANICNGETYNFNGRVLSQAGIYTDSLQTINGCDSVVNLTLNVHPQVKDSITENICDNETYNFNGRILSEQGTYIDTLQTINGCDSVVFLTLNINPTFKDSITATINYNESYDFNGRPLTQAGTYINILQTADDCDSVVILTLHVRSGIENIAEQHAEVNLYPNPASKGAYLTLNNIAKANIVITDIHGRVVKQIDVNPAKKEIIIDVSGFATGTYTVTVQTDKTIINKKLIVK